MKIEVLVTPLYSLVTESPTVHSNWSNESPCTLQLSHITEFSASLGQKCEHLLQWYYYWISMSLLERWISYLWLRTIWFVNKPLKYGNNFYCDVHILFWKLAERQCRFICQCPGSKQFGQIWLYFIHASVHEINRKLLININTICLHLLLLLTWVTHGYNYNFNIVKIYTQLDLYIQHGTIMWWCAGKSAVK